MSASANRFNPHSQTTEAFQQSEKLFRALIENSSDALALVSDEGVFTYVSPPVQKILGFTPEELLGCRATNLFPPEYLAIALERFEAVSKTPGLTVTIEHPCLHKDGSWRWIESTTTNHLHNPTIQAFVTNFRDINKRKQSEEELRRAKEQFEAILHNAADGITVQDASGSIVYVNNVAATLSGFPSAEAMLNAPPDTLRQLIQRFVMKDEEGNLMAVDELPGRRALQGEKNVQALIQYVDTITGQIRWSLVKSQPILDEDGRVQLIVNVVTDISERQAFEQRKDEFISMASHELKTPVTSIKGFTQILHSRYKKRGDEESLRFLTIMNEQLDKLTKLISDLLDISKMQAGKLTFQEDFFDLSLLVQETVEHLQATTSTHKIQFDGIRDVQVFGDRDRLGQVLVNLLTNAIKYSPQADTVIVRVAADLENAIVSVQDFGIGIQKGHQDKIFERFYQVTDPEGKTFPGLGIGLYISSEIVKQHNGQMRIESIKGAGSTFSFTVPLRESKEIPQ